MKAKIFLMVVCVLILSNGCISQSTKQVSINKANAGTTVELRVGDKLEVSLEGNLTTGYNWTVESLDSTIIKQLGDAEFKQADQNQNRVGAGGVILYRFEAIKSGKTPLKLIYHRSWEKDVPPIETYEVTIMVN